MAGRAFTDVAFHWFVLFPRDIPNIFSSVRPIFLFDIFPQFGQQCPDSSSMIASAIMLVGVGIRVKRAA